MSSSDRFEISHHRFLYASSSCVKIMECQKMIGHTAYPIFYDVEPSEVRNQSGEFGEAFAKHVEKEILYELYSGSKLSNLNLELVPYLEELHLEGCHQFIELCMPVECPNLKYLNISGSKLSNLNLALVPYLEELHLEGCHQFVELYMAVECPKLKYLNISGCKLSNLNLGLVPYLEELHLEGCHHFVELCMPVECPTLKYLYLGGSMLRNLNLGLAPYLEELHLEGCNEFVELHMPVECPRLKYLNISGSKLRNLNLGLTPNIESLDFKDCYRLQEIHAPVGCLKNLVYLNLSGCSRFAYFLFKKDYGLHGGPYTLAKLELTTQSLDLCPLHHKSNLPRFQFRCLYNEYPPLSSGNLEKLLSFGLCACTNLESFSASIYGLQQLGKLTLEGSIPEVPKDLYQLESLEELTLSMKKIKHLPDSICLLKHLRSLELKSCFLLELLPKDLGILECLEKLHLSDCIS
ncbi:hypothetical protein L1987_87657 [Smallanthus sonchifolius]|nr:hypothetical protein L1987_87657 [Smallanthus sonchifolius]